MTAGMTTKEIIARLKAKHSMVEGKWATIVEFQRIDFLAVGTWPSTDFVVHGYEVKSSRADWLTERKKPEKSEEGRNKVDYWWLAAPAGVVKHLDEIPKDWGYLLVDGVGTHVVKEAPQLRQRAGARLIAGELSKLRLEREAFAGLMRRFAYAEADREALMAAAAVVETRHVLDAAAIKTGRWTSGGKQTKAEWEASMRSLRDRANQANKNKKRRKPVRQDNGGW